MSALSRQDGAARGGCRPYGLPPARGPSARPAKGARKADHRGPDRPGADYLRTTIIDALQTNMFQENRNSFDGREGPCSLVKMCRARTSTVTVFLM